MQTKIEYAEEEVVQEKQKYYKAKIKLSETIHPDTATFKMFNNFKHKVANEEWNKESDRLNKKIDFLEDKFKPKAEAPDTIREVKVSDAALGVEKPLPEPSVNNFDKEKVTKNMKSVLQLPPKFATYNPVKLAEVKTEIQKCFYKERLNISNQEERNTLGLTEKEAEEKEHKEHELFDYETKVINFSKLRPTDLKTNKSIFIPPLAPNKVEIEMAAIEGEIVQTTNHYIQELCDKKGYPKEENLTKENKAGIAELKEECKNGAVVTTTDKSSKLNLNTLESYEKMGEPHVKEDRIVEDKELKKFENVMNGHAYQLCRILRTCTAWEKGARTKSAMTNHHLPFSCPPPCSQRPQADHSRPGDSSMPSNCCSGTLSEWSSLQPHLKPPKCSSRSGQLRHGV